MNIIALIEKIENKPKKNKSEAQIEQFRQMSIKRQAQMAQDKKEKALLEAKILLKEEEEKEIKRMASSNPQPPTSDPLPSRKPLTRTKSKPIIDVTSDEDSTEEEIIHIKKNKKPKKKTIIIDES